VETPKVKREDPPPVIQGLSDEEVKRHKNSGETADRADSTVSKYPSHAIHV
jgi:hypothetical protein